MCNWSVKQGYIILKTARGVPFWQLLVRHFHHLNNWDFPLFRSTKYWNCNWISGRESVYSFETFNISTKGGGGGTALELSNEISHKKFKIFVENAFENWIQVYQELYFGVVFVFVFCCTLSAFSYFLDRIAHSF